MQRELVERARSGDLEAFSDLARDSLTRLYAVATLILRDPHRAEDAVQEALLHAWQSMHALRDPDAFEAWLHRITVRACYKSARKEKRRVAPIVSGNTLTDSGAGIVAAGDSGLVEGNTVAGGRSGIVVTGGSGTLDGNSVTGASGRGLAIGGDASPTLTGNTACDNGENLWVSDGAEPVIDESNEICEGTPAE